MTIFIENQNTSDEAVGKSFYHLPGWNKDFPKLQILTVEDLLNGKQVQLPPNIQTYKRGERIVTETDDQGALNF